MKNASVVKAGIKPVKAAPVLCGGKYMPVECEYLARGEFDQIVKIRIANVQNYIH